jgi:(p)ppGpp synthase/HD superfamily hydrolase
MIVLPVGMDDPRRWTAADRMLAAKYIATQAHAGQRYGEQPYTAHLAAVVRVLRQHGFTGWRHVCAGWLHDAFEDTALTFEEVQENFGSAVALWVHACTGVGENRKARNAAIYAQLRDYPEALPVKLADRIANATSARAENAGLFRMYAKEYPAFREALYAVWDNARTRTMWAELDRLFEYEEVR